MGFNSFYLVNNVYMTLIKNKLKVKEGVHYCQKKKKVINGRYNLLHQKCHGLFQNICESFGIPNELRRRCTSWTRQSAMSGGKDHHHTLQKQKNNWPCQNRDTTHWSRNCKACFKTNRQLWIICHWAKKVLDLVNKTVTTGMSGGQGSSWHLTETETNWPCPRPATCRVVIFM